MAPLEDLLEDSLEAPCLQPADEEAADEVVADEEAADEEAADQEAADQEAASQQVPLWWPLRWPSDVADVFCASCESHACASRSRHCGSYSPQASAAVAVREEKTRAVINESTKWACGIWAGERLGREWARVRLTCPGSARPRGPMCALV